MSQFEKPKAKIMCYHASDATDYDLSTYLNQGTITERLNAIDDAGILFTDIDSAIMDTMISYNDLLRVYLWYEDDHSPYAITDLRFYGFVEDLSPTVTDAGEFLDVKLRSYGRCLLDLVCGEQYGSESSNPTLDTVQEILTDASKGLIPFWVNKLLNTGGAGSSGYSVNTSEVQNLAGGMSYIYFPFKPAKNGLDDLTDILQAIKGSGTAGGHWILRTIESPAGTWTHYLLYDTVGNHASAKWPTWWNTDQAGSTIEVKKDMIVQQFTYQRPEANYILYDGVLRKPGDGDKWTELNAALWGSSNTAPTDDDVNYKIGLNSVKYAESGNTPPIAMHCYYPSGVSLGLDITKMGGKYNIPTISFNIMRNTNVSIVNDTYVQVEMITQLLPDKMFQYSFATNLAEEDTWYEMSIPIGPYYKSGGGSGANVDWHNLNTALWTSINAIGFKMVVGDPEAIINIDGLCLNGHILRGAKKLTAGSAAEPYYKVKVITDNVGKDDTVTATDTGVMARLAAAELFRTSRTPLQGQIRMASRGAGVAVNNTKILPGQKAHLHGVKRAAGTFKVNKDMRVTEHRLDFNLQGIQSTLAITDDLLNGSPLSPITSYNLLRQATNPDYQNRQIASIKTRDLDITQAILEKTYAFASTY